MSSAADRNGAKDDTPATLAAAACTGSAAAPLPDSAARKPARPVARSASDAKANSLLELETDMPARSVWNMPKVEANQ